MEKYKKYELPELIIILFGDDLATDPLVDSSDDVGGFDDSDLPIYPPKTNP